MSAENKTLNSLMKEDKILENVESIMHHSNFLDI